MQQESGFESEHTPSKVNLGKWPYSEWVSDLFGIDRLREGLPTRVAQEDLESKGYEPPKVGKERHQYYDRHHLTHLLISILYSLAWMIQMYLIP